MKPENIMWLLVPIFMIHDFEEIIMISAWLQKPREAFHHLPELAGRVLDSALNRSIVAFALAVAEEFVLLTIFTVVTVEMKLYTVWTGMLLAYFLHLLMHVGQSIAFRRYTPAILTSLLTSIYCLYVFWYMNTIIHIRWSAVMVPAVICALSIVNNLPLSLRLADLFERWLRNYGKGVDHEFERIS